MYAFIDAHRAEFGVAPICEVLAVAPSAYYAHRTTVADPTRQSARVQRDAALRPVIRAVWTEEQSVYGATKTWKELLRRDHMVARCTVERLMRDLGLRGVVRGARTRTTIPGPAAACPADLVVEEHPTSRRPEQATSRSGH